MRKGVKKSNRESRKTFFTGRGGLWVYMVEMGGKVREKIRHKGL